jgi:phage replication-related protein YjqB (UPF0714/DUF867 family)
MNRRQFIGTCAVLPTFACSDDKPFANLDSFRGTSVIEVKPAAQGQQLTRPYCSLTKVLANWVGIARGDQVRIYRSTQEYALYTVSELRDNDGPTTIRMSKTGRERLGTIDPFVGQLDARVTADLTASEAQKQNEFIEQLVDDGVHSGLLVAAPHGGGIEFNTDIQAEYLASLLPGVSSWICKGWREPNGAHTRWHVGCNDMSPNSFAGLAAIAHRGFKHVVTLHGMSDAGVIIGGRAPAELREHLGAAIAEAIADPGVPVVVAGDVGPYRGVDPANIVNWLTADGESGIQIEQGTAVRNLYWAPIAEAIAEVLEPLI